VYMGCARCVQNLWSGVCYRVCCRLRVHVYVCNDLLHGSAAVVVVVIIRGVVVRLWSVCV